MKINEEMTEKFVEALCTLKYPNGPFLTGFASQDGVNDSEALNSQYRYPVVT